jgi:hypothetical protein
LKRSWRWLENQEEVIIETKISEYEFVVRAIKTLAKPPYKGIHSVIAALTRPSREYFGTNPVEATTKLAQEGKIVTRPVRGGVTIYLPEDAPAGAKNVLNQILEGVGSEKPKEEA